MAQKRGGGNIRGESVFTRPGDSLSDWGLSQIAGDEPTPEFAAELSNEYERLFEILGDDRLTQIAVYRIEGYSTEDIAERVW